MPTQLHIEHESKSKRADDDLRQNLHFEQQNAELSSIPPALIARFFEILDSETTDHRVKLAEDLIATDATGIAHLMLAREHAGTFENQRRYYETAISLLEKRAQQPDCGRSYHLAVTAAVELAIVSFEAGKRAEAVELLRKTHIDPFLPISQELLERYQFVRAAYHVCLGEDDEARTVLDTDAIPSAEWFFMNALLRYRQWGDSFDSRGALAIAMGESECIGYLLSGKDLPETLGVPEESESEYADLTRAAWESDETAVAWIVRQLDMPHQLGSVKEPIDEARLKRWLTNVELGYAHMQRDDMKSAKRCLNMALRESEQLGDGGVNFFKTARMIGMLDESMEKSRDDLVERIAKYAAKIDKEAATEDLDVLHYKFDALAEVFMEFGQVEKAETYGLKALDVWSRALKSQLASFNSFDATQILTLLTSTAIAQEKYDLVEKFAVQNRALKETFLGPKHFNVVDSLHLQRFALRKLDRHDEERAVFDQLLAIDENANKDDDYGFECEHDSRTQLDD